MISLINEIINFKKGILEQREKAKKIIENLQNFSKKYYNKFDITIQDIKNKEAKITQEYEKMVANEVAGIKNKEEELEKIIEKKTYTDSQSTEIIKKLEEYLKNLNDFFSNVTPKNVSLKFLEFLKKGNGNGTYIETDDGNISFEEKKCFLYAVDDNRQNDTGCEIIYNGEDIHNEITEIKFNNKNTAALTKNLKGLKKIINTYNDDVEEYNKFNSHCCSILASYVDNCVAAQRIYEDFLKKANKGFESEKSTNPDLNFDKYRDEEVEKKIEQYLGVTKDSTSDVAEKKFEIAKVKIEEYKSKGSGQEIIDIIHFIRDFLTDIKGVEISNKLGLNQSDYVFEEMVKNEAALLPTETKEASVKAVKDNNKIIKIKFYTNENSVYMNDDGSYVNGDDENDNREKICDNAARNKCNCFNCTKEDYEEVKVKAKAIEKAIEKKIKANVFLNMNEINNSDLSKLKSSIIGYYTEYGKKANEFLKEVTNEKKAEYQQASDDKKKEKIIQGIKSKMSKYLLTCDKNLIEYRGLKWCQGSDIEDKIKEMLVGA